MSVEPSPIELEECELVNSAPGTALLRVTARTSSLTPRAPTLLIRDGDQVHRLKPLPSPPDPEGWLRAAYSLRTTVIERQPTFSLEFSPGSFLELPEPNRAGRKSPPEQSEQPERPDPATVLRLEAAAIEANRTASVLHAEAQELRSERDVLGEEVERLRGEVAELEQRSEAIEDARRVSAEVDASLARLRGQVEEDLARLEQQLEAARAEASAARESEERARNELAQLRIADDARDRARVIEQVDGEAREHARAAAEREIRAALATEF